MDFEEAHWRGRDGEEQVSTELRRLLAVYEFKFVDDVLLSMGKATAQLDHIVVDRRGILIVETKLRNALIRGTSTDRRWTACYRGGHHETFQNPLRQNDGHENVLRDVLKAQGVRLTSAQLDDVIVFVGANLSALDLRRADAARVVDLDGLLKLIGERQGRADQPQDLSDEQADRILEAIRHANKSADQDTVHRHELNARQRRGGQSMGVAVHIPAPRHAPCPVRKPPARKARQRQSAGVERAVLRLLPLVAVFALTAWLLTGGIFSLVQNMLTALTTSYGGPSIRPRPEASSAAADISTAKEILRESAPDVYTSVTDLDTPSLGTKRGVPTYTWHYLARLSNSKVKVVSLTLAIDSDGVLRGVERH